MFHGFIIIIIISIGTIMFQTVRNPAKEKGKKKKKGPWVHWVDCSGNDCRDEWHKEGQMSEIAAKETKKNKMTKEK